MQVQGVGEVTALTLVTQLPELGNLSNKEVVALVGLAPYCQDSGKKNRTQSHIWWAGANPVNALYGDDEF
ncbi:transposase [Methylobacter sp.]|uniref:transposase n=1 Tax=Methylobacter sp. TaxID=2051955 RepID=UPI001213F669|nr:transposase [Methylobacter sp.]TAK61938.1 MAG: hypothetical protein EPO18_12170 [Methylobacter sp.]